QVFLRGNWATDVFVTNYLPLIIFPTLYVLGKQLHRQPLVNPDNVNLKSGVEAAKSDSYEEPPPHNLWDRFWVSHYFKALRMY
ncbi:hypothetical protein BDV93DRAFT_453862, partial [Ceratobasidium sp. AG-I]